MKLSLQSWFPRAIFLLFAFAPSSIEAQPTVAVEAHTLNNYHDVLITFSQNDLASMDGCHYNLFTADNPRALGNIPAGRLISVATFYRPLSVIQIIASPLPHVAQLIGPRHRQFVRSVKVYFRTLLSCPQATNGLGEIFSVKFKTFAKGSLRSVKALRKSMKYHMKYYEP